MKTRKLSSDDVIEIVRREFLIEEGEYFPTDKPISRAKEKIKWIESLHGKNKFSKWIDRNQGNFWFFILITAVLFAAKVSIEAYLLNK